MNLENRKRLTEFTTLMQEMMDLANLMQETATQNEQLEKELKEQEEKIAQLTIDLEKAKAELANPEIEETVPEQEVPEVKPEPPLIYVRKSYEPFVINKGGVYENLHIRSTNTKTACIEINTPEEVIIRNSFLEYAGIGLKNHNGKTNVKVLNNEGKGLPHTGDSSTDPRRFMSLNNVINLLVQNNEVEGSGFLTTQGEFTGNDKQGINVLLNNVKNINGVTATGRKHTNFVQIMNSRGKGIYVEIAYNRVVNEYGKADVEDNINIYNARGFAGRPIWIHHNRIQGAYYHPAQEKNKYYSGGGIITDGDGDYANAPAYVLVEGNLLTDLGNYHLGMAAGHHITMRNNVALNDGILPDGRKFWEIQSSPKMNTSGIWANPQGITRGVMDNNLFEGNIVGVNYYERQNNISVMKGAVERNNTLLTKVDRQLINQYVTDWENKMKNVNIGLLSS